MYNHRKKSSSSSKRRKIVISVLVLLVVAGGSVAGLELTNRTHFFGKEPTSTASSPDNINYGPPTEEDAKAVDDQKEAIVKQEEAQKPTPTPPTPNPPGSTKKTVKPVITRANNGEVSGYISGIFEDGGTCTATFKNGTTETTKSSQGFADVSTTMCAPIAYSAPVQAGWSVTLRYESAKSQGVSDAANIQ